MRVERSDPSAAKGWYAGPWNSDLAVSIGYANEGIDEPHTFPSSSSDYFHFVAHLPGLAGAEAKDDKERVPRSRLGL